MKYKFTTAVTLVTALFVSCPGFFRNRETPLIPVNIMSHRAIEVLRKGFVADGVSTNFSGPETQKAETLDPGAAVYHIVGVGRDACG